MTAIDCFLAILSLRQLWSKEERARASYAVGEERRRRRQERRIAEHADERCRPLIASLSCCVLSAREVMFCVSTACTRTVIDRCLFRSSNIRFFVWRVVANNSRLIFLFCCASHSTVNRLAKSIDN